MPARIKGSAMFRMRRCTFAEPSVIAAWRKLLSLGYTAHLHQEIHLGKTFTRRTFLQSTAAIGVAATLKTASAADAPAAATSPATTQARRLNIGIVGVGGRGGDHVREIHKLSNANVIAICDVDAINLVQAGRVCTDAKAF